MEVISAFSWAFMGTVLTNVGGRIEGDISPHSGQGTYPHFQYQYH